VNGLGCLLADRFLTPIACAGALLVSEAHDISPKEALSDNPF
jgi:hypothetical protein